MRRTFALCMLAGLLVLPGVARAQSDGSDQVADPETTDAVPVNDAPAVDTSAPASAPVAPSAPVIDMSGRVAGYLQAVRGLPGTLFQQENRLDTLLQNYRLGALSRDRLVPLMPRAADAAATLDSRWQQIIPPPNLVTVHNYALAAVSETHAGVQITVDNFMAGGGSIPPSAAVHFDNSDHLMAAALDAISAAAGPVKDIV